VVEAVDVQGLKKEIETALRRVKYLPGQLKKLEEMTADLQRTAFLLGDEVKKAREQLAAAERLGALPGELEPWLKEIEGRAEAVRRRARTKIAAELSRLLAAEGMTISGTLPVLTCGLFRLRFRFDASKPHVAIEYGPGIARLGKTPIEAPAIAEALVKVRDELEGEGFEGRTFREELRRAYRMVCLRRGWPEDGRPAPIMEVLAELVFARQPKAFRSDPVRERFQSYGRVRFSYDLFRLRERRLGDEELRLSIATRDQTRRPEDHLWVPVSRSGKGTNYSALSFRRNHEH